MPCPLPRLWGVACDRFGWPRPACLGQCVFYRGMVWLLPLVRRNVIVTCLVPAPLWGVACGRFGWPRPACLGQCVRYRGMVWLLPLVSSNVIVMFSLPYYKTTKYDVALFSVPSVPVSAAGIILHRPPSLWFAWFVLGAGAGRGRGPGEGGGEPHCAGGGGPGPESIKLKNIYTHYVVFYSITSGAGPQRPTRLSCGHGCAPRWVLGAGLGSEFWLETPESPKSPNPGIYRRKL